MTLPTTDFGIAASCAFPAVTAAGSRFVEQARALGYDTAAAQAALDAAGGGIEAALDLLRLGPDSR